MRLNMKECLIEFNNGVFISYWQCLTEVFNMHRFNWSTFQFLNIEFENDRACQQYSITLVLLCCGIRLVIPVKPENEHEVHKTIRRSMSLLKRSCYGYTPIKGWNAFRKQKREAILVYRDKPKNNGPQKKLFIQ